MEVERRMIACETGWYFRGLWVEQALYKQVVFAAVIKIHTLDAKLY